MIQILENGLQRSIGSLLPVIGRVVILKMLNESSSKAIAIHLLDRLLYN